MLIVVRSGALECRDPEGRRVAQYDEGDFYPDACLEQGERDATIHVVEDSLLYELPCSMIDSLSARFPPFRLYFADSLREKLERALASLRDDPAGVGRLGLVPVHRLIAREPVCASPETSVRDAARRMSEEGVSALLLTDGESLVGIVTDRDLRQRCLAAGLAPDRPVSEIMTTALKTIGPDAQVFEAQLTMTRESIHHLPVVRDGRLIGLVASTDLIRHQSANSVYIAGSARKAATLGELIETAKGLPELHIRLVGSNVPAKQVALALSAVLDAIHVRLLELAESRCGPPPVPYAWAVCGSLGREEPGVRSDQDNALVIDDAYEPEVHGAYFEELARFVSDGLNACGIVYCPGDAMATNPRWRRPLSSWKRLFGEWIARPDPKAMMHASIFFDMRPVGGASRLLEALREHLMRSVAGKSLFLAHLAANATRYRPPLGFFRQLVLIHTGEHAHTFDIKAGGLQPIIALARVYALEREAHALSTEERLKVAGGTPSLSSEGSEDLLSAFAFIATLRARHHAEQLKRGEACDNFIDPSSLSRAERHQLKDAFALVRRMQDALGNRYQIGRLF